MRIHWEEDEFRYWEFTHVKALDAADWDTAFALESKDIWELLWLDLRCAEQFGSLFHTRKGLRFLASKIPPLGLGGRPANPKGAFVPKPKIFPRTHTYIRIKSSKMSSNKKSRAKTKAQ